MNHMNECIWQLAVSSSKCTKDQSNLHFWLTFSNRRYETSLYLSFSLSNTPFLLYALVLDVCDRFHLSALKFHWIGFTSKRGKTSLISSSFFIWKHEILFVCSWNLSTHGRSVIYEFIIKFYELRHVFIRLNSMSFFSSVYLGVNMCRERDNCW